MWMCCSQKGQNEDTHTQRDTDTKTQINALDRHQGKTVNKTGLLVSVTQSSSLSPEVNNLPRDFTDD